MNVIILVEHDNKAFKGVNLNVMRAAKCISEQVDLLVIGSDCAGVASAAANVEGVGKVILIENPLLEHQLAEDVAPLVADYVTACGEGNHGEGGTDSSGQAYGHLLVAATTTGKNILPRVAALMDVQPISEVVGIESPKRFKRPIYAGNSIETVESKDKQICLSIRAASFDAVADSAIGSDSNQSPSPAEILRHEVVVDTSGLSAFVGQALQKNDRPELTSARVIISGGRGLGSKENFEQLYRLADYLDAAVGASRAAVDAGFASNDMQVGQTGKIVAPELYIAVGLSGAIQHLAGMKESKVIVAINKDEDAPIFQVADYGLVADLFEVLPQLEQALK